ncbi:hypothetical protein M0R04_04065 [Candidatus Dojkabacteria bacterium]|jgi:hypothetical protein|nr:hypothetical protein [Candidatus Dojkabacteria bacterium]
MAAYSELTVEQYSDFSTTIILDDVQGDSLNLTSYNVASQLRKSPFSETSYDFETWVSDSANGVITIAMTWQNTANITAGRYMYDVVISSGNTRTRVVEGIVNMIPGVTR